MTNEEKTRIYMNGVAAGRMEIIEQVKQIMKNRYFPDQDIDNQLLDMIRKYQYENT